MTGKSRLVRKGRGRIHKEGVVRGTSWCGRLGLSHLSPRGSKGGIVTVKPADVRDRDRCGYCFRNPVEPPTKTHIKRPPGPARMYATLRRLPICSDSRWGRYRFAKTRKAATCAHCRKKAKLPPLRTDKARVLEARALLGTREEGFATGPTDTRIVALLQEILE